MRKSRIAMAGITAVALPISATSAQANVGSGPALTVEASYILDILASADGGARRGVRNIDHFEIGATVDLERFTAIDDAMIRVSGIYNNGKQFSELVGDAQIVSNIETGTMAARLYEAWIDKGLGSDASIRAGLYDLNSEFDVLESADVFIHSSQGMGTDIGQSGLNGPSIFPATALATRIAIHPAEGWAVRLAAIDGVPGNPERPARTTVSLGDGDGALLVGEVEAPLRDGKLILGHWRYTAPQAHIDETGETRGSDGFYLRGETRITGERDNPVNGLDGFFRLGVADERFVPFSHFAGGGITYTGPFTHCDRDRLGFAFAIAVTGGDYRSKTGSRENEMAVELTYDAVITDWLSLQPSIHYIANPQGDPGVADALALGLRARVGLNFVED